MAHWSDKYVGTPYIINEFDCVHLVVKVLNDEFGHDIDVSVERAGENPFATSNQIEEHLANYVEPTGTPREGDVVLMKCKGRLNHCGVVCIIDKVYYVLHNLRNIKSVVLHKVRELNKLSIEVEGFYAVKNNNEKVTDDHGSSLQTPAAA